MARGPDSLRSGLARLSRAVILLGLGIASSGMSRAQPAPDTMPAPPGVSAGNAVRGCTIIADRQAGFCLLCHPGPFQDKAQHGNLAPTLDGIGSRLNPEQLRLRVTHARKLNESTIMPSYGNTDTAPMTSAQFSGRPILSAQQIEDVVACLAELK